MLFSSHRRYSLDKQDLSTALLEGAQRFLHSKKNLKLGSKKEFSKQGETAPSMQTNIRKRQNKMTLKSDCARDAKELEKVALGRPLREVPPPSSLQCPGHMGCILGMCLPPCSWPTMPSAKTNWDIRNVFRGSANVTTGSFMSLPGSPVVLQCRSWDSQVGTVLWREPEGSSRPWLRPWKVENAIETVGSNSEKTGWECCSGSGPFCGRTGTGSLTWREIREKMPTD